MGPGKSTLFPNEKLKRKEKSPHDSVKGRRRRILKYNKGYNKVLHNKGLLSRIKDFTRTLFHLGKGHFPDYLTHSSFSVSPKGGETKKLRNTCDGLSPGTQAH